MGIRASIKLARSFSNCFLFAFRLFRLRATVYEGIEDGRYICFRLSDWGKFPHALYGQMCDDGRLRVVSYKPISPKKRKIPPPLFEGKVKWGDRNRSKPGGSVDDAKKP